MHKLIEYVCDELDELERKVDKGGKLSASEMQYLDTLAHTKKNLLKADEMWEDSEYSNAMDGRDGDGSSYRYYPRRMSYARGRGRNARRDAMGRYSREGGYSYGAEDMVQELRDLMEDAPDDRTRSEIQKLVSKLEMM